LITYIILFILYSYTLKDSKLWSFTESVYILVLNYSRGSLTYMEIVQQMFFIFPKHGQ